MRGHTVTIEMPLKRGKVSKTIPLYQYDYGQKLLFSGVEMPTYYEVHFSNEMHGEAVTQIGDDTGVDIPDTLLTTGLPVYLWVFLHDTVSDGETEFQGVIPIIQRASVSDTPPTPTEQSVITQAIAALNNGVSALNAGVTAVETAVENVEDTIENALQEAKDSGEFDGTNGVDGVSPTIDVEIIAGGHQVTVTDKNGSQNFDVMNGTNGIDAFSPTASVTKEGTTTTITITDIEGTTTAEIEDSIIDDTAGDGDTTETWSADKLVDQFALKANKADPVFTGTINFGRSGGTVGENSVALGGNVTASGKRAFATGMLTSASGTNSSAFGSGTVAGSAAQHVVGRYNKSDTNDTYVEIVGNGEVSSKSNARALDWNGNEYLKGDLYVGCDASSENGSKVAKISDIPDVSTLAPKASPVFTGKISLGRKDGVSAGSNSIAVGNNAEASGMYSQAFGDGTAAKQQASSAEGLGTIADGIAQRAFGRFNVHDGQYAYSSWISGHQYNVKDKVVTATIVDSEPLIEYWICNTANSDTTFDESKWDYIGQNSNRYVEIVGNGTGTNARANARSLDFEGNEYLAGDLYVGCDPDSTGGTKVAKVSELADLADDVEDLMDGKADIINESITESNAVQSITDGASGKPMAVKCAITPVQDLHGYDKPWYGGTGKNLVNPSAFTRMQGATLTVTGNEIHIESDGSKYYQGAGIALGTKAFSSGTYYVKFKIKGTPTLTAGTEIAFCNEMGIVKDSISIVSGTSTYSDTMTISETCSLSIYLNTTSKGDEYAGDVTIYDLIISTTNVAFEPYENICPISGWTQEDITRAGVNLADPSKFAGVKGATVTVTGNEVHVVGNGNQTYQSGRISLENRTFASGTYYVKFKVKGTPTLTADTKLALRTSGGVVGTNAKIAIVSGTSEYSGTLTIAEDCYLTLMLNGSSTGSSYAADVTIYDLIVSTTDTPYTPFADQTYTISFQAGAGTVYGGSLTVNKDGSGKLVVDRATKTYNGTEAWKYATGTRRFTFYSALDPLPVIPSDAYINASESICSHSDYLVNATNTAKTMQYRINTSGVFNVYDPAEGFADLEAFTTYLGNQNTAGTPLTLSYKVATPTEYDLTAQQITSLLGINNVYASTGNVLSVDYSADTKLFIASQGGGGGGGVSDVQVNGTSVVTSGVANVPVGNQNTFGVFKAGGGSYGIDLSDSKIIIAPAGDNHIKAGTDSYRPIAPARQQKAVFYGLSKVAGYDLKDVANVTLGTYPEDSKSAIHQMLDAPVSVSGSTPSITAKSGVRYICGEVSTLTIVVPSSGIIDVTFDSGSTATVLTVTPPTGMTMKWAGGFDPTSLDANTTYEINIADGCLGVCGKWT